MIERVQPIRSAITVAGVDGNCANNSREPHSISVGTARGDVVEILLRVHPKLPPLVLEAEHAVEADLKMTTGRVSVLGAVQPPTTEYTLPLESGRYRVRVSYLPSTPSNSADLDAAGERCLFFIETSDAAKSDASEKSGNNRCC